MVCDDSLRERDRQTEREKDVEKWRQRDMLCREYHVRDSSHTP